MIEQEETFSADLYNMILGGLIALKSEQSVGSVSYSPGSESIFLGKWLKLAKKQRRFPKTIATEIDNFLIGYAKKGRNANLSNTFSKICTEYQICKIRLQEFDKSPKHRFNAAMEILTNQEWVVSLPVDHDFEAKGVYKPAASKELFMTKWDWLEMFDEDDNIGKPVSLFVAACPQEVIDCLYDYGFILVTIDKGIHHHFKIYANNIYKGEVNIPSKFKDLTL